MQIIYTGRHIIYELYDKEKMVPIVLTTLRVIGFAGAFAILLVCPGMGQVFAMFEPENTKDGLIPQQFPRYQSIARQQMH